MKNAKKLSEAGATKVAQLRKEDPKRWTFSALAKRFQTTPHAVYVAAISGGAHKKSKRG